MLFIALNTNTLFNFSLVSKNCKNKKYILYIYNLNY